MMQGTLMSSPTMPPHQAKLLDDISDPMRCPTVMFDPTTTTATVDGAMEDLLQADATDRKNDALPASCRWPALDASLGGGDSDPIHMFPRNPLATHTYTAGTQTAPGAGGSLAWGSMGAGGGGGGGNGFAKFPTMGGYSEGTLGFLGPSHMMDTAGTPWHPPPLPPWQLPPQPFANVPSSTAPATAPLLPEGIQDCPPPAAAAVTNPYNPYCVPGMVPVSCNVGAFMASQSVPQPAPFPAPPPPAPPPPTHGAPHPQDVRTAAYVHPHPHPHAQCMPTAWMYAGAFPAHMYGYHPMYFAAGFAPAPPLGAVFHGHQGLGRQEEGGSSSDEVTAARLQHPLLFTKPSAGAPTCSSDSAHGGGGGQNDRNHHNHHPIASQLYVPPAGFSAHQHYHHQHHQHHHLPLYPGQLPGPAFSGAPTTMYAAASTRGMTSGAETVMLLDGAPCQPSRAEILRRYRAKRARRSYGKHIRYQARKVNADARPRVKGRFIKVTVKDDDAVEATFVVAPLDDEACEGAARGMMQGHTSSKMDHSSDADDDEGTEEEECDEGHFFQPQVQKKVRKIVRRAGRR